MKIRYEVIIISLWILSATLITLGCVSWNNTTLPLALGGAVCVLASEKVVNKYEH